MKPEDHVTETAACKIYGLSPAQSNRDKLRMLIPHEDGMFKGRPVRLYLVADVLAARSARFEGTYLPKQ